jgi:hypothetical protein
MGDTTHKPHYGIMGVPAQNNSPGQRSGSITWFDHSGSMWLFGGVGLAKLGPGYYNYYKQDLWKYIPDTTCEVKACLATQVNDMTELTDQVNVYPNPASGSFNLQLARSLTGSTIFLYDILGNLKQQLSAEGTVTNLCVEDYAPGIYILQIKKDDKKWVKKIVIE